MYETLADSTDPHLVKFQLDLCRAVSGGVDPVDIVEQYCNRIVTLHVKDRAEDGSFADVGEGTIDFAEIFDTRTATCRWRPSSRRPDQHPLRRAVGGAAPAPTSLMRTRRNDMTSSGPWFCKPT